MEKEINILELLKDCPSGMELDCTIYDDVTLYKIDDSPELEYPIQIETKNGYFLNLTKYGTYTDIDEAKCVIFPKGKTTWEGFVPPCQFNDGDVIFTHTNALKCNLDNNWVSIFKEYRNNRCACYVCLCLSDLELYHDKWEDELLCELCEIEESRLATEEEKQKLFVAIKEHGYKWNDETKTLEKLPKFKVGDIIQYVDTYKVKITEVNIEDECYEYESIIAKGIGSIPFSEQDNWKLISNKFDITTLKSFKSRVLVRSDKSAMWKPAIYGIYKDSLYWMVGGSAWIQCIPYKDNEYLLGTTKDCDKFYKTWE